MARKADLRALGIGLVSLWASACGAPPQGEDVELQTANLVTENALTANALTANALTANALTANGLKDPLARQFMKYVVSCALPDDQSISMTIDGTKYTFPGSLGLAPDWGKKGGSCDEECQRWVSGCVLARVDFLGVEEEISIRGANPALRVGLKEFFDYSDDEATYFGNVFLPEKQMFACLAPDEKQIPRVCGPSLDNCPMKVVGSCAKACSSRTLAGGFVDCSSSGRARKPEVFHESVTVFLPKSGR